MKTLVAALLGSWVCIAAVGQGTPPGDTVAKIIDVDGDVNLIRLGLPENTRAKVGDLLKNADQLKALSADATVQLECANGASQTLMDGFDAILNAADATTTCAIDLHEGTSVATSNPDGSDGGRASIRGGPVAAESQHTQFGVTVPAGDAENSEAFVIEGKAAVRRAAEVLTLTDGQMWSAKSAAVALVSEARYEKLANNFARIDVRRSGKVISAEAQVNLAATYYKTLKSPGSALARDALAETYAALAIPESPMMKYNTVKRGSLSAVAAKPERVEIKARMNRYAQRLNTDTFPNPMVGNHRLDACLHWGVECGQAAATAFCKTKGFTSAKSFEYAYDIGAQSPTLVMGDNAVCSVAACDGFASIKCQ